MRYWSLFGRWNLISWLISPPDTQIWTSAWYLPPAKPVHYDSTSDWKWSILGVVYYRSWMKCAGVTRTSQNDSFFTKSMFPPQWTEHPHDIWLFVNLVHFASPADWKWPILGVVYYMSRMKCAEVERHRTDRFSYAVERVRASSPAWRCHSQFCRS